VKAPEHLAKSIHRREPGRQAGWLGWVLGGFWLLIGLDGVAGPVVSTESPIGFFTNVAARLLQAELKLNLNRIQIYPTNQYTPSVHRLLQVTANLYDATTDRTNTPYPHLPSVFRPVFANESSRAGSQVFIRGFEEVTNTSILSTAQQWRDLDDVNDRLQLKPADMVYGIPLVIGAKKGFPNFNEFAMQTQVQVERKLQFTRIGTNQPVIATNQMFIVGISNVFGVEAWNSYSNSFPRNLQILVWLDFSLLMTNEADTPLVNQRYMRSAVTNVVANTWTGYDNLSEASESYSFLIPLFTNNIFLTNSTFWRGATRAADRFTPLTSTFQQLPFYVPHWWLTMKTRLRFAVVDTSVSPNRIVDFVNLAASVPTLNITDALARTTNSTPACPPNAPYSQCGDNPCMWCTNRYPSGIEETKPTYGIRNQIGVCLGQIPLGAGTFRRDFPTGAGVTGDDMAVDFFRFQLGFSPVHYPPGMFSKALTFAAPFQPYRNIYLVTSWQANDPLVHYTVGDLKDLVHHTKPFELDIPASPPVADNLEKVNLRYEPWGIARNVDTTGNYFDPYELAAKDPVPKPLASSDDWDFPTNQLPDLSWVGRVHRGTPWQTIYLKAPGTSLAKWIRWTGNDQLVTNWNGGTGVAQDAFFTQPTNDWRLASLIVSLLNTNNPWRLMSANQGSLPAWLQTLDGLIALTNDVPDNQLPHFTPMVMQSNSPQAARIAAAISALRSSQPDQRFRNPGDILAVPELSTASPWLNLSSDSQQNYGLSDEAYEAIPRQLLPRLRADSIGSVVQNAGAVHIQFSGVEGAPYAVQVSSNLLNWTTLSTNYPVNGVFDFAEAPPPGAPSRFYRSVLLP
jgi:hypothetical protein